MIGNMNIQLSTISEIKVDGDSAELTISLDSQGIPVAGKKTFLKSEVDLYLRSKKTEIETQIAALQAQITTVINLQTQLEA